MTQDDASGNGRLLARIDERTKNIAQKQEEHFKQLCDKIGDHEERIRDLENKDRQGFWRDIGAFAAAAAAGVTGFLSGQR